MERDRTIVARLANLLRLVIVSFRAVSSPIKSVSRFLSIRVSCMRARARGFIREFVSRARARARSRNNAASSRRKNGPFLHFLLEAPAGDFCNQPAFVAAVLRQFQRAINVLATRREKERERTSQECLFSFARSLARSTFVLEIERNTDPTGMLVIIITCRPSAAVSVTRARNLSSRNIEKFIVRFRVALRP